MTAELAACTVVSKNHLSYARVLAESFRAHHPGARVFVLLVDRNHGHISPLKREPFELIGLEQLSIKNLPRLSFQYNVLELNCAAKPFFLAHLLRQQEGFSRLLYLDSDMLVCGELHEASGLLREHSILLTPHLIERVQDDGKKPGYTDVLEGGVYNAGFVGLRNDATAQRFVDWWGSRVYDHGVVAAELGLNGDQLWLDLVPGLFDSVHILRHPGYNLGYWGLSHREIKRRNGQLEVNGRPLCLMHFSGLDLENLEGISRHQDRFSLDDVPELGALFEGYRDRILAAGYSETRGWPYAFGTFDNGAPIPPAARRLYWQLGDAVERFGNPFETAGPGSFWQWLNEEVPAGSGISRLWYHIYQSRSDLPRSFPDIFGKDRRSYLSWVRDFGRREAGVSGAFGPPSEDVALAPPRGEAGACQPWRPIGLNVVGHSMSEKGVGEALRAMARALTASNIPYSVVDLPDVGSANTDRTLVEILRHNPYPINLIHLNADALPQFVSARGPGFLRGRYNIGVWMWELPEFPSVFHGAFSYLDEVWVGSSYCLEAITRASPIPVVKIPLALPGDGLRTKGVSRAYFGLPDGPVIFLFMFDVHSIIERKNPSGVIEAFKRAFKGNQDVRLVLKLVHGTRRVRRALSDEAKDTRVLIIDRVFGREEVNSLMEVSDCYVSLHRSEGFGVTMAEAMALGKPVIATGYSANLDFMTPRNGFLVGYDLVKLERDYGPYPRGSMWADPDIDQAAEFMRVVYENPDVARELGHRAARDIWQYLAPGQVAQRIKARLRIIAQNRNIPGLAEMLDESGGRVPGLIRPGAFG